MHAPLDVASARTLGEQLASSLPVSQRKSLGQHFTGLPLARVLAHLAITPSTRSILDPMAGHGDLLDAVMEAARARSVRLERVDGIEIDKASVGACWARVCAGGALTDIPSLNVVHANAFEAAHRNAALVPAYDLVITNPPYVRYQRNGPKTQDPTLVRAQLLTAVGKHADAGERTVLSELANAYSGLADLSVPAVLLAGSLVAPGGNLALVMPATWRSRNYADVIRYMLAKMFAIECIVEDVAPGWFPNALVRTQLIVAKKLKATETEKPIALRSLSPVPWVQIAPVAMGNASLVGSAFRSKAPEISFAKWVKGNGKPSRNGLSTRPFDRIAETARIVSASQQALWFMRLEAAARGKPIRKSSGSSVGSLLPEPMIDLLPAKTSVAALPVLKDLGIEVGQGLRTGCNRFFYVDYCSRLGGEMAKVKSSNLFGPCEISVPSAVLKPVLRRQSEVKEYVSGKLPDGRVLDLRGWVLPEDMEIIRRHHAKTNGSKLQAMPSELARYVRVASTTPIGEDEPEPKFIPDLSAVRTNASGKPGQLVSYWYMLPDFAPRHLPLAFIPRINHGIPWSEANVTPHVVIDANFSTLWSGKRLWSGWAIKALLNSAWCRAYMESLGTPFGGGALKLEATHLRNIRVPTLADDAVAALAAAGKKLGTLRREAQKVIDTIVLTALADDSAPRRRIAELAALCTERAESLSKARQRAG